MVRRQIKKQDSKEVEIGAGTVSSIIQEFRQNDPEFDLLREVAVKLKNQGINIESFASLVRLRERILNQIEAIDHDQSADERIESLIVNLEVFCFKQNISIKEFVNPVHDTSWRAEILGVPLEKLGMWLSGHWIPEERPDFRNVLKFLWW